MSLKSPWQMLKSLLDRDTRKVQVNADESTTEGHFSEQEKGRRESVGATSSRSGAVTNLEHSMYSITLPSLFDNTPSSQESDESELSQTTVVYTDDKINYIMKQYIDVHGDDLTDEMINMVQVLISDVEENILTLGIDFHRKLLEPSLMKRYAEIMPSGEGTDFGSLSSADRILKHNIVMIIVHKMLLKLYLTDVDEAHDLLKQIAVSHALMKLTSEDFRMMNICFGKYLLKQNLMNDDNMPPLVTYFNKFTNYITEFYDSQQFRTKTSQSLVAGGTNSKARENYRIMKKWKTTVETIREAANRFQKFFHAEVDEEVVYEDDVTLDTLILKQRHWCLGKFVKKDNQQVQTDDKTSEE